MRIKKGLKILTWILGILTLLSVTLGWTFYKRFIVYPPSAEYAPPQNLKEAQSQDLEYLTLYAEYDRSLDTETKRDSFFSQIERLESKLPVSEAQFEMGVAKALAFADNGHSNISAGGRAKRMNSVPLRFYWFKEGLFTILAQDQQVAVLGCRITSINGICSG